MKTAGPGVGIDQIPDARSIKIFPNPVTGSLTIEKDTPGVHTIKMVCVNGQLMYNGEMEGHIFQVDLSSFQEGVYFITIGSDDLVTTRKIIKIAD